MVKHVAEPGVALEQDTLVQAAAMDSLAKTGVSLSKFHDLGLPGAQNDPAAEGVAVTERSDGSSQFPWELGAAQQGLVAIPAIDAAHRST